MLIRIWELEKKKPSFLKKLSFLSALQYFKEDVYFEKIYSL